MEPFSFSFDWEHLCLKCASGTLLYFFHILTECKKGRKEDKIPITFNIILIWGDMVVQWLALPPRGAVHLPLPSITRTAVTALLTGTLRTNQAWLLFLSLIKVLNTFFI